MREKREQEIFEAAYRVLAERGYKGASMLAIAKAAGASNETLYNWYGNKQGLLAAMIHDNAMAASSALQMFFEKGAASSSPLELLEAFGTRLLAMLTGERAVTLNRAAAAEVAEGGELGRLLSEHGRSQVMPLIAKTIKAAQDAGQLRQHDPSEIAEIYIAMLIGDLQIRRVIGVTQPPAEEAIVGHAQRVSELLTDLFGSVKAP